MHLLEENPIILAFGGSMVIAEHLNGLRFIHPLHLYASLVARVLCRLGTMMKASIMTLCPPLSTKEDDYLQLRSDCFVETDSLGVFVLTQNYWVSKPASGYPDSSKDK
ncbi:hypothetical protein AKJ16_DCAP09616 [Drosera capensis]